jgi:cysteine-rich repeat protein
VKLSRKILATVAAIFAVVIMLPAEASAHTTRICWEDVGPVTTFYAGTYHSPFQAPSPVGGIIVDGFTFPFSGWIYPASLPATASCQHNTSSNGPTIEHYQTFTSTFVAGAHTISFTASNVVQAPWGPFPPLTFGGGACTDADFDGICNDDDSCPLEFNNDGDGDGVCGDVDNCPLIANGDQADLDGDGNGDLCEGLVCGNGVLQFPETCDDGNIAGGDGCSAICTVELSDLPPNSNAGPDQAVNEQQTVNLDGSLSNDPDLDTLTYAWVQVSGTAVTLTGANTSAPSFTAPTVAFGGETLTFKLTVTANSVEDDDTVSISVVNVNHVPVSDADFDQSVAEGVAVALDGTNSFDIDGDTITYAWVQVSGTPTVALTGATTSTPSFTGPIIAAGGAPGVVATLVFELTVADGFPFDAPAPY